MNVSDPLVGHVLDGRYEIVKRIARGGMATVYRAIDRRLTRDVAVKVMHEGLGDDQDFARKFDREARAAAALSHQHVVSVFDQGRDNGRPYIVMEYVEGSTLRHLITREAPLDPLRALELLEPVVSAVAAAHDAGLIHRDIKPENVLISTRGQIKVADFGLAKAISAQTATATQGMLIGTVSYLPPELVTTGKVDLRSDVYSAGVVLFEMLTGTKPHTGDTPIQVAYAHVNEDIPAPSSRLSTRPGRTAIPPYLDALVRSATSREADLRPASARELLENMQQARTAIAAGVTDDPLLTRRFSPAGDPSLARTARLPRDDVPRSLTSAPTTSLRRLRVSPSTPISPVDFENSFDGSPYYEDGEPSIRERVAPVTAPLPKERTALQQARERQARRRRRSVVLALLVVLLTLGLGYGGWAITAGRMTQVPDLTDISQADATTLAEQHDISVTFSQEFSETTPSGDVMSTDPAAGTKVPKGTSVHVVTSRGKERITVPTLTGRTLGQATAQIASLNLKVGTITRVFDEKVKEDVVLSSSPSAATSVRRDALVDLTVSKGPKPIKITDYRGASASDAEKSLERAGFKVKVSRAYSTTVRKSEVIKQSPSKGEGKRGDTVKLTVSRGPKMISIPATPGMSEANAAARLKKVGFKVAYVRPLGAGSLGIVAYSSPGAGRSAAEGSTITLYIG